MSVYDTEAFAERVSLACAVIASGGETTRTFDTCCEMSDGDAVAVAVYRRSRRNPDIRRNIWRYLSREYVLPIAWRMRRVRNLAQAAREERAASAVKRTETLAQLDADQEARNAAYRDRMAASA